MPKKNDETHIPLFSTALTRRDFIHKTSVYGGAVAIASQISLPFKLNAATLSPTKNAEEIIKYSACLVNCGSRCPLKVHVKNDIVTKISSEDGINESTLGQHQIRPCLRGRSVRWRTYHPDRLKYPMLRVGKRGEGKFKRISWDEATTIIAKELRRVIDTYGNEAIYYQYGTGTTGANLQGRNACKRLLSLAGGFLDMHGTYSTAQINTIQPYVFGPENEAYGVGQQSLLSEIKNSDLVVMFGQNIAETRMSGGGQITEIYHALAESQAKVIIIDPRRNDSVIAFHSEWIPIRPGTDAALVAAIGYTLIQEKRIDDIMLRRYCIGWDSASLPAGAPKNGDYKSYLLGQGEDQTPKTPEWAAKLTGIPAQRIVELAREIINAKAAWISQGWGLQRTANGEHASRAIMMLPIITGQFGRPGTNIGTWGGSISYPVPSLAIPNPIKTSIPTFLWTKAIENGTEMTAKKDFVKGKEKLDTSIKFLWNYASNVTGNQHSDLNRTHKILSDESLCEFILVWDNHMTASAKYADLLLPDVSSLETEDLINNSYQSGAYSYLIRMEQAIKPLWENRPNYDVLAEIAEKMGLKEAFTQGRSYAQWIEHAYQQLRKKSPQLPPFEETHDRGVIDRKFADSGQYIALKAFRDNPYRAPLQTPSGKIEMYSTQLANLAKTWELADGDRLPAIPEYVPAAFEGVEDTLTQQKYPLQLTGYHTKGHCHSTYANIAQLQEAAPNCVWINPLDAQQRQIQHGDWVEIFNDRGRVYLPAKLTQRIMPGVVAIPQGAWAKTNEDGVDVGGCINRLTSQRPSALAKGNPQHTNLVDIQRVS